MLQKRGEVKGALVTGVPNRAVRGDPDHETTSVDLVFNITQNQAWRKTGERRKDRHRRWAEILMPHRFVIEYRPGQTNEVADGLSRYNFDDVHYENFPLLPPSRFSQHH